MRIGPAILAVAALFPASASAATGFGVGVGFRPATRDKKKPFRASLATRGLRAGRHTITAKVSLRRLDRPRTTSTKSLNATIRTC